MGNPHGQRFFGRVAYWVKYCDRIRMFSVQTTLGNQRNQEHLGNQPCYNIPSHQWLKSGERGCSLDNGPKVNQSTANIADKTKRLKKDLFYKHPIWSKAL